MSSINMMILHNLTQEEATRRAKSLLGSVKSQFAGKISDLKEEWNGSVATFSLLAMGKSVSGRLAVESSFVDISIDLPFDAILFKGEIEAKIRERIETLLAK